MGWAWACGSMRSRRAMSRPKGCFEDLRTGRLDEKAVLARIPAGRIADGDDIAEAVLFLCSDRARHILGQVLSVDGGEGF